MTLTADHRFEIVALLEMCGISPFNVCIADDLVIFHSNGLRPDEIECARYMLVKYLASI